MSGWRRLELQRRETRLDELAEPAAADFLLVRTRDRRQHVATDVADALTLAHELGGLALALEQAGAFIAKGRSSIQAYLPRWRERDTTVRKWNDPRLTKYPRAVVSTWDATVQQLSPEGLSLLQQLSWMAPESFPRFVLPDGSAQDALVELASFSLVKFEKEGGRFRVHRLVQEVTRERQTAEERRSALLSALDLVKKATPPNPQDIRTWLFWDPLRSHAMAVVTYANQHEIAEPTVYLMNQLGLLLLAKASYGEAEPLIRRALEISEASYGPKHPDVAVIFNNLAQLLQATNRLAEAEPLMRRAWLIDEESYGPNHPDVARDLHNLAKLFQDTNRLGKAEPLMRRVVCILIRITHSTGYSHPQLKLAFGNYVSLLQASSLSAEVTALRLQGLGSEAGLDAVAFSQVLQQVLQ